MKYVVDESILPESFRRVIAVKKMVMSGKSVSQACKIVSISRNTFYRISPLISEFTGLQSDVSSYKVIGDSKKLVQLLDLQVLVISNNLSIVLNVSLEIVKKIIDNGYKIESMEA